MIIKIHIANKKDPAENRQDLLQIGILSLWVQYSTRNMGMPSAKRKSDKTQIGLFIGGEVFHFGGDYDIIKTKICIRQYRIILSADTARRYGRCQAKSADNTGCCKGERRQWRKQRTEAGAAVAECEGLLPSKHDAGTATRHYRAFWQRRCRAAAAGEVLKPQGGNCAVLP